MKARNILKIAFIASLMLPAACDVKDPIFNTPHPDHGTVTLTTDWRGIGSGLTPPSGYTVKAGSYSATLSGATNTLDHLFEPGTYPIHIYNVPEHITVSGTTATVATATGNVDGVGGFVQSSPGWLFTSATDAVIKADADHALTAVMQQQVRQLTLIVTPTGGTTDRIEQIEGYLTGAASTLDFATGTHTAPLNVELQFAKITEGANAGSWAATVRLLGTAGPGQKLNARIRFTDGNPQSVDSDSDLTTDLASFNADKRTPLTLGSRIVETPTGTGFTATITDWETVTGGPVVAD